jgi:hypothetical protein
MVCGRRPKPVGHGARQSAAQISKSLLRARGDVAKSQVGTTQSAHFLFDLTACARFCGCTKNGDHHEF